MIRGRDNLDEAAPLRTSVDTDPVAAAARRAQMARLARNSAWLQAHAGEVYPAYRGKYIAVAGEELFVADTVQEALAQARAAHPDDDGILTQYIPKRRGARLYAHRGLPARLR